MASELSKLCICAITLLSLTIASSTNEIPADGEIIFSPSSPSPYPEPSDSSAYSLLSLDSSEHSPTLSPSYIDTLAAELEAEQLNLSPEYPPSPAPYFTKYPSPPPYIESETPEMFYEQAPAPELSSVFGSDQSADTVSDSPYSADMAPHPTLPFDYTAEDESGEFGSEYYSSEQSKNRMRTFGFVLGAVCLVALAGFVYNKKKKDNKPKPEDQYELTRRMDV